MRKLIIIGIIVVIVIGIPALVLLNLDGIVNRNKDYFINQAEESLGRKITIDDISVSLRGGIGIRLDNFVLADDPNFSNEPFIKTDGLQVNAKLLPLLQKRFEIKRIILNKPVIQVIRNENGELNISTLTSSETKNETESAAVLSISLLNAKNGELHFVDHLQGVALRITDINSQTKNLGFDKQIDITLEGALESETRNIDIKGTIGPIGDKRDQNEIPIDATLSLAAIQIKTLQGILPALDKGMPEGSRVSGHISLEVAANGTWPDLPLKISFDATELSLETSNDFVKAVGIPLTFNANVGLTEEAVNLSDIEFVFHTARATGDGTIALATPRTIDLDVAARAVPLSGWEKLRSQLAPYKLSGEIDLDAHVSGSLEPGVRPAITGKAKLRGVSTTLEQYPKPFENISADVTFDDKQGQIDDLSLAVGDSRITGTATVSNWLPMKVHYRVDAPTLALVDVRPPNPVAKRPEVLKNVRAEGDYAASEPMTNRGTFSSADGTYANFDYQNLKSDYSIIGKEIDLQNLSAKTLDGGLTGSGHITMDDQTPAFRFVTEGTDINLIKAFDQLPLFGRQHLRGKANLNLTITGSGKEWEATQKTLTGDGVAELFEGELVGLNVFENLLNRLTGQVGWSDWLSTRAKEKYPKLFGSRNTAFRDFKSTFVIEDGKLKARNLELTADEYTLVGRGTMDMNGSLDLALTLVASRGLTDALTRDHKALKYLANSNNQIEIPFRLSGLLPKTKTKPEDDFIKTIAERALADKGRDIIKDGLRDLFGRKKGGDAPPAKPDTTGGK